LGEPLRRLLRLRLARASRRAIRSITRVTASQFRGWFRYYPSRKKRFENIDTQIFIAMKSIILFLFLVFFGTLQAQNNVKNKGVKRVNELVLDSDFCWEAFHNDRNLAGILLLAQNEDKKNIGFYIDATEVCNLHYRNFLTWISEIHEIDSPDIYATMLPDTNIWLRILPDAKLAKKLSKEYFRYPAFDYYPVVGLTPAQMEAYTLWRSDRTNEILLIGLEKIMAEPIQKGEYHFTTATYLSATYEGSRGEKTQIEAKTGEVRRVRMEDNIILPDFELPDTAELAKVITPTTQFKKEKSLAKYRKMILAHAKIYPCPAYYQREKYSLPAQVFSDDTKRFYQFPLHDAKKYQTFRCMMLYLSKVTD
jgi:hypothetical protein